MTTPAADALYAAQHQAQWGGKPLAVFNPHGKPVAELPVIYGFNNGGSPEWLQAVLIAQDGTCLGSHICSAESYMPHDLGCIEGSRPDRHETFQAHYPDGYRMEFIGHEGAANHPGLDAAVKLNQASSPEQE